MRHSEKRYSERMLQDLVVLFLVTAVALVLGFKTLPPYDFGWHLAGGLWMLEHGTVPQFDPFGAGHSFWLCYSWLFEVALATGYQFGGFRLLQVTQALLVIVLAVAACLLVRFFTQRNQTAGSISELLPLVAILILTSPIWYFRPQTISLILFGLLILFAESGNLRLKYLIPLTILWANIHVYWIAIPLVVLLYFLVLPPKPRSRSKSLAGLGVATACVLSALCNPYTWRLHAGMIEYLLNHSVAYGMISEFEPLSPKQGIYFIAYLLVVFGTAKHVLASLRSTASSSRALMCIWLVLGIASFLQIKYLAFFGVISAAIMANTLRPKEEKPIEKKLRTEPPKAALPLAIVFFCFTCFCLFSFPSPLSHRQQEALEVSASLQKMRLNEQTEVAVFNEFNDGGFLALAFWLSRPEGSESHSLLTSIDGRTLVMGEERLADYNKIVSLEPSWCSTLSAWRTRYAVLPVNSPMVKALLDDYQSADCQGQWVLKESYKFWSVLEYLPLAQ